MGNELGNSGGSFSVKEEDDGSLTLGFPYIDVTITPSILSDLRNAGLGNNEELKNAAESVVGVFYGKEPDDVIVRLNEFVKLKNQIYADGTIPVIKETAAMIEEYKDIDSMKDGWVPITAKGLVSSSRFFGWGFAFYVGLHHIFTVGPENVHITIYIALGFLFYFRDYILTISPQEETETE